MKTTFCFPWSYEKKNSANQNNPILMKTTNIKLYENNRKSKLRVINMYPYYFPETYYTN